MKTLLNIVAGILLFVLGPCMVYAQVVPREMVVMEIATGTWCTYCPGAAMGAEDLLINGCRVAVIENHNGDPFANVYSNSRNTYWGISGYPTAVFDGITGVVGGSHSQSMYADYLPKYNQCIAIPANIQLGANITNSGLDYTAVITIDKVGTVTATDLVFHFFVTVSNIQYPWQGQSHLEHVTARMVPDQNGTPVSFAAGNTQTVTLNFSLDQQWAPEDVEFVFFVQSQGGKEVFNGMKRAAIDLTPGFTASSTTVIKGETVTFTNETFGGYIGVPETWQWIFQGGTPSSSTDENPSVTYAATGIYDVTLIVDRGSQIDTLTKSAYITVNAPVGIDPQSHDLPIISPNPSNGNFSISAKGTFDVRIMDVTGRIIENRRSIEEFIGFSLGLPAGVYFIGINTGGKEYITRMIVR